MIHLIINRNISDHVSEDIVSEFEKVILSCPDVRLLSGERGLSRYLGALTWRAYQFFAFKLNLSIPLCLTIPETGDCFAVLMGIRFRKCMPYFTFHRKKYLFMFDAWPQFYNQICEFTRLYRVSSLFVTSRQSAETLRKMCCCPVYWIPEGIDPSAYSFAGYRDKDIDVIEFGRSYSYYHNLIRDSLAGQGKTHLYEQSKGELIFKTRTDFVDGLSRSKISICFPSSITHPDRSGDVETMTIRYLQSMASKCLIIGQSPVEMTDLFGYNPVIEMDPNDPCGQLSDVLSRYEEFIPLIEYNYEQVAARHTWSDRWGRITELLSRADI